MQKLIEGVHRFRESELGRWAELFRRAACEGQQPHTLFITCSDSRVLAELVTQSKPGDLFVVKNAGNIVPPAGTDGGPSSTGAAIEFAVECLGVRDIVVCGHSRCGAMQALLDGIARPEELPHLARWIELAAPVRELIATKYDHLTDPLARISAAAEENALLALERLRAYPCVARRLAAGELFLHAWFFKIATAELFAYDAASEQYVPIVAGPAEGLEP